MSRPRGTTTAGDYPRLAGIHLRLAALALAAVFGREVLRGLTPWPPQGAQLGREIASVIVLLACAALAIRGRVDSRAGSLGLLVYSGLVTLAGVSFLVQGAQPDGLWHSIGGALAIGFLWMGRRRGPKPKAPIIE